MTEILSMGGYGGYVWSSFAITLMVIVVCTLQARARHRKVLRDIEMRTKALEANS